MYFQNADMPMSTTFQGGLRYSSYSPHLRRSLPTLSHMSTEPPKIYPYHLLVITNYRLPADVDRCNLEVCFFFITCRIFFFKTGILNTYTFIAETSFWKRIWTKISMQQSWILQNASMAKKWHEKKAKIILKMVLHFILFWF